MERIYLYSAAFLPGLPNFSNQQPPPLLSRKAAEKNLSDYSCDRSAVLFLKKPLKYAILLKDLFAIQQLDRAKRCKTIPAFHGCFTLFWFLLTYIVKKPRIYNQDGVWVHPHSKSYETEIRIENKTNIGDTRI